MEIRGKSDTSIYFRGQGSALPLQSVACFFQIGIRRCDRTIALWQT
ncbi:hypothetical protein FDUTEX481_09132 [Tolypothrix sp. PCC 7601]|nr:hypothetical protein FDUTEX481_09132 [Tolypothrix sp. PCC 7601]